MTIPLVVGIDGSEASLEAVDWAAQEATLRTVPLHLLYAAGQDQEATDVLGAATGRARETAPGVPLSTEVRHEDAALALVDIGRNALALVVGSRGLGGLSGMLLGSVGLAVAARADCPVVVVRGTAEHRDGRFGSVVVGVEEGEESGTALRFALREARARRCRLVAVHAWSTSAGAPAAPRTPGWYAPELHRRPPVQVLDDALRGPAETYRYASVSRRVVEVPARQALLEAASEADLLVVGARRRKGHMGLQLGLTNHAMLHHAPCPVAVVPQI
ncbi:universal stress protein [Streptomyces sp. NPDC048584]|uniref:universal stress protein n=1 Tax=Streptomyces sp. NPDC048584 TaxID=3365573 RepID=UPI003713D710